MEPPYPDLPREDDTAFFQLERTFRKTLEQEIDREGRDPAFAQLGYVNKVFAAADALGIEALAHLCRPEQPLMKSVSEIHRLRDEIDQALVALRLRHVRTDPASPTNLPEDRHQRIGVLIAHILADLATAPAEDQLRRDALNAARRLQTHHQERRIRMEDFVSLGHAIAQIGRVPATERIADRCWRWLRIAMGLVDQSVRARQSGTPGDATRATSQATPPSAPNGQASEA